MFGKSFQAFLVVERGFEGRLVPMLVKAFNKWYEVSRRNISISLGGLVTFGGLKRVSFFAKPVIRVISFPNRSILAYTRGREILINERIVDDEEVLYKAFHHELIHFLFNIRARTVEEHLRHPEFRTYVKGHEPYFPILWNRVDGYWLEIIRKMHFRSVGDLPEPKHIVL